MKNIIFNLAGIFILFSISNNMIYGQKIRAKTNGHSFTFDKRHPKQKQNSSDCTNSPYRTIDGTCNNRSNFNKIEYGAADIELYREILPTYGLPDHYNDMSGQNRPSARAISNALCGSDQVFLSQFNLSSFVFTWGQFLDHDITLTPEDHLEFEPIPLPFDENLFTVDIAFFRSSIHTGTGVDDYRQQTNLITSWIDGSNVYGSDATRAKWLRTLKNGKLKTSEGNLLPFNTITGESDGTLDQDAPSMAGDQGGTVITFVAGDVRAAEQPGLTALHTLFVRHHNLICDRLRSEGLRNDEEIYQKARKEVGAIIQAITYNEFLPALGITLDRYSNYNSNIQPDISNIFATAAYRLGHTMVTDELLLLNNNCKEINGGSVSLLEGFFNPSVVVANNIDPILKGLSSQVQNEVDLYIIDNLRNFLFGDPSTGVASGIDLASLNIQRGRDHGLANYNMIRHQFTGKKAVTFSDITTNPEVAQLLADTYGDIEYIDAWVGFLAEDKLPGKSVGMTLNEILKGQFQKLRDGDRYFYLNDRSLKRKEIERIDRMRLSDVIVLNSTVSSLQNNVFYAKPCENDLGDDDDVSNRSNSVETGFTWTIYPNPVTNALQISLEGVLYPDAKLTIMNLNGEKIESRQISSLSQKVNVDFLSDGMYILSVKNGEKVSSQRFTKISD